MVVENELVIERRTINRENRRYQDKSTNNEDKRRNQFAGSRRIHWDGRFLPPHRSGRFHLTGNSEGKIL